MGIKALPRSILAALNFVADCGADAFDASIVTANVLVVIAIGVGVGSTWLIASAGSTLDYGNTVGNVLTTAIVLDIAPFLAALGCLFVRALPTIGDLDQFRDGSGEQKLLKGPSFPADFLVLTLSIGFAAVIFVYVAITSSALVSSIRPELSGCDLFRFLYGARGDVRLSWYFVAGQVLLSALSTSVICAIIRDEVRVSGQRWRAVATGALYCISWFLFVGILIHAAVYWTGEAQH